MNHDDFLQCYELVYCLHPCLEVADAVLGEAYGFFPNSITEQQRLPQANAPTHARLTPWQLLQRTLLRTSQVWELDQERGTGEKKPAYYPNAKVMLVRFMKHLAQYTLFRADSYYLAIALGSCLYTYEPSQACEIVALPRYGARYNGRGHFKLNIQQSLKARFQHAVLEERQDTHTWPLPSEKECQFVRNVMQAFRPWETNCLACEERRSWRERLAALGSEWDRKHAILCECVGFDRLAQEWALDESHDAPHYKLRIPQFKTQFPQPGPHNTHLDDDPPLSDDEIHDRLRRLHDTVRSYLHRRITNQFTRLRIYIDGVEHGQLRPDALTLDLPTIVPSATSLAVYGEDAIGLVPLALFDISEVNADENGARMTAVLESGATLVLAAIPHRVAGEVLAWHVTLRWEPEEAVREDLEWCDALLNTTARQLALLRLLRQEPLGTELKATLLPRLEAVAQIVRRAPGNEAWKTDLLMRLEELSHVWKQGTEAPGRGQSSAVLSPSTEGTAQPLEHRAAVVRGSVIRWFSSLWHPPFAGIPVTAADVPPQTHVFPLADGDIRITCAWRPAYQQEQATLRLTWRANLREPRDLWVRFTPPDDPTMVLAEIRLGSLLASEKVLTTPDLGFDPSQTPWALTLLAREPQTEDA